MYKVMIVEDEMLVRNGLKNLVAWEKFNMVVTSETENGLVAWEAFNNEKPDIIFTDLKMPFMGGMELIEKVRSVDKLVLIVILSCLDEFEQVRKAMSLGVFNYCLKLTITEDEMETIIQKVKEELDNRKKHTSVESSDNDSDFAREKLFKEYIFNNKYSKEEFAAIIVNHKLKLSPERMLSCILELDDYESLKYRFNDQNGYLIKTNVLNEINLLLERNESGVVFCESENRYVLILSFSGIISEKAIFESIYNISNEIRNMLENNLNTRVSIGISNIKSGYAYLKNMYGEALKAIEQRFVSGSGVFSLFDSKIIKESLNNQLDTLSQVSGLEKLVDKEKMEIYKEKIKEIQNNLQQDSKKITKLFHELIQWTSKTLIINDNSLDDIVFEFRMKLDKCVTVDEMINTYKMFVDVCNEITANNQVLSKEISEAVKYIQLHFTEEINLNMIAEYVNLSSGYLSKLFKKELNENIVDYWNRLRIEKAKEMLLKTKVKTYEIAEKIGFSDNTYFSKVFKKLNGIGPNEFRKYRK